MIVHRKINSVLAWDTKDADCFSAFLAMVASEFPDIFAYMLSGIEEPDKNNSFVKFKRDIFSLDTFVFTWGHPLCRYLVLSDRLLSMCSETNFNFNYTKEGKSS